MSLPTDESMVATTSVVWKRSTDWLACEHPERPPDSRIVFCAEPCRSCAIAMEMVLNHLNPLTQPKACARAHRILAVVLGEAQP